jgi:hypothetical protein
MAWECPACGFINNEDFENICACGKIRGQDHYKVSTISMPQPRVYFWGAIRFCLGIVLASLIWALLLHKGIILVYLFALAIAIALSGLLSLLTNKSFSQLSESWSKLSGISKLIIIPVVCIVMYFVILVVGIALTSK